MAAMRVVPTLDEFNLVRTRKYARRRVTPVKQAAGPFHRPISPAGDVYISDGYGNARVHRFSADGRLEKSWRAPGKTCAG
jgi:hypothetical protein